VASSRSCAGRRFASPPAVAAGMRRLRRTLCAGCVDDGSARIVHTGAACCCTVGHARSSSDAIHGSDTIAPVVRCTLDYLSTGFSDHDKARLFVLHVVRAAGDCYLLQFLSLDIIMRD
jgi:hypothetical protein